MLQVSDDFDFVRHLGVLNPHIEKPLAQCALKLLTMELRKHINNPTTSHLQFI